MSNLEQRLKRLETHQAVCNHSVRVILENPTDEELERVTRELFECPSCRHKGTRPFVIRTNVIDFYE
jgi:hypothetical protein